MKLWLLETTGGDAHKFADVDVAAVVRAGDEDEARRIAAAWLWGPWWSDPAKVKCTPLSGDGPAGVVLKDFKTW